jgi:hypothetical protein
LQSLLLGIGFRMLSSMRALLFLPRSRFPSSEDQQKVSCTLYRLPRLLPTLNCN